VVDLVQTLCVIGLVLEASDRFKCSITTMTGTCGVNQILCELDFSIPRGSYKVGSTL
jgi:hypothetical protein